MTELHDIELRGCAPEPLMSYLKALGILRLVAEQKDENARAWWRNDTFYLRSTLDREGLAEFFLEEYRPTPVVSPWNSSSSITSKSEAKNMDEKLLSLESPRFQLWNEVVPMSRRIYSQSQEVKSSERKEWILAQCRVQFPDDALDWLDATYVLTSDGSKYPPLLGTGGNDGRLEFSRNFFQNIVLALNMNKRRNGDLIIRDQVTAALLSEGSPRLEKRTNGFFNPGSVGGANSSVGFNGGALTNPWDYVLMFEGALMFAGAAARRLSPQSRTKVVFPFTVDNSAGGYGTSADSEYGDSSRAEFWAPVWDSPASFAELSHLVSEGRAQVGRRQAATGTDFARAVAGLGADRGVQKFHRYGFVVRNGLAYLAAPLGRFHVPQGDRKISERADVLFDLDGWMNRVRGYASGNSAPAGLRTRLSQIERAIIEFCQRGEERDLQDVLIAIGQMERWLGKSSIKDSVSPVNELSRDWLIHANNNSPEFRLACSLASILPGYEDGQRRVGPVRENLEPVNTERRITWKGDSKSFVWNSGDLLSNMLAVLERRCLEGRRAGLKYPPLGSQSQHLGKLGDIVAFLNGDLDDQRIADLSLPLSVVDFWHRRDDGTPGRQSQVSMPLDLPLPTAYAVMKLTLLPRKFVCREFGDDKKIAMEPRMLAMLRAGRIEGAYQVAYRRLKASGLQPSSEHPGIADGRENGHRLAAALLFPLDARETCKLARRALRLPDNRLQSESESAEHTRN